MLPIRIRNLAIAATVALLLLIPATGANAQTIKVGAYTSGATLSGLQSFEALAGRKQDYALLFENWDYHISPSYLRSFISRGTIPVITWEPWNRSLPGIGNGSYDSYIRGYARDLKAAGGTVLLRPMHEMNGDWYPWGAGVNGNTPAHYVKAFRRIVTLFRAEGATNVKFVFSPNNNGQPGGGANSIPYYFPGDSYISYTAIDAYNFGTTASWSRWTNFGSLFGDAYHKLATISARPIMIGETSSTELGGNKAAWIHEMFSAIKNSYPRIQTVTWFHKNKETDWRINSSSSALTAFKYEMSKLHDTVKPRATLKPVSWWASKRRTEAVTFRVYASDASGIRKVVFRVDGKKKMTDYRAAWSYRWSLAKVKRGRHTISMTVYDKAGNIRKLYKKIRVTR